jgi:hypothetical protein
MELLFVVLGGALLGVAARLVVPGRHSSGSVLVPAIGTAASAIVWVALTWLGMAWDGGWIWVAALACAALSAVAAAMLIARSRDRSDARFLASAVRG